MKTQSKQINEAHKENQESRAKIEKMNKELEEAKKQQASANELAEQEMMMGNASKGLKRGNAIKARQGTRHMSRESGTAMFFKNLQNAGLAASNDARASANHMRAASMANSA